MLRLGRPEKLSTTHGRLEPPVDVEGLTANRIDRDAPCPDGNALEMIFNYPSIIKHRVIRSASMLVEEEAYGPDLARLKWTLGLDG